MVAVLYFVWCGLSSRITDFLAGHSWIPHHQGHQNLPFETSMRDLFPKRRIHNFERDIYHPTILKPKCVFWFMGKKKKQRYAFMVLATWFFGHWEITQDFEEFRPQEGTSNFLRFFCDFFSHPKSQVSNISKDFNGFSWCRTRFGDGWAGFFLQKSDIFLGSKEVIRMISSMEKFRAASTFFGWFFGETFQGQIEETYFICWSMYQTSSSPNPRDKRRINCSIPQKSMSEDEIQIIS